MRPLRQYDMRSAGLGHCSERRDMSQRNKPPTAGGNIAAGILMLVVFSPLAGIWPWLPFVITGILLLVINGAQPAKPDALRPMVTNAYLAWAHRPHAKNKNLRPYNTYAVFVCAEGEHVAMSVLLYPPNQSESQRRVLTQKYPSDTLVGFLTEVRQHLEDRPAKLELGAFKEWEVAEQKRIRAEQAQQLAIAAQNARITQAQGSAKAVRRY